MTTRLQKENHEAHVLNDGGYRSRVYEPVVKNIEGLEVGTVQITFCDVCHIHLNTFCDHSNNTWNEEGTVLSCNLCGEDVT